ncbi:MAG: ChbG/HpnK family deacetylase [bacterium]
MEKIVIIADDLGTSAEINDAVREAFEMGVLTGASIIMNAAQTNEAIYYLKTHHELSAGIHLNLTSGTPISPLEHVPSLTRGNGTFFPPAEFFLRLYTNRIRRADMFTELENQCRLFKDAGLHAHFVNGHHYIHALPAIARVIKDLCIKYKIPQVILPLFGIYVRKRKTSSMVLKSFAAASAKVFYGSPIKTNERYVDFAELENKDYLQTVSQILNTRRHGTLVFCCHPSRSRTPAVLHPLTSTPMNFLYRPHNRPLHLKILTDPKFAEMIKPYLDRKE